MAAAVVAFAPAVLADDVPLFAGDDAVSAVLSLPLTQIYDQARQSTRLYMPGQFTFRDDAGEMVRLPVKARARGVFRRQNDGRPFVLAAHSQGAALAARRPRGSGAGSRR